MAEPHPLIPFRHTPEAQAGFIYGIVTAMAVSVVLADKSANVLVVAAAALGTAFALAFTHLYAHWLAGTYSREVGHGGVRRAWRIEVPTLVGPLVIAGLMIAERLLGVSSLVAIESALWLGTFLLFVLGFRIALQAGRGFAASIGFGLLDAAIGAVLVLVKVLVH